MYQAGSDLFRCESPYEFPEVTDGFFSRNKEEKKPAPCKPQPEPKKCEPPNKAPEKKACAPKPAAPAACPPKAEKIAPSSNKPCGCARRHKRKSQRLPRSRNPFIVFFLSLYYKQPERRITQVAREAGKEWCRMPDKRKELYRKLARLEQKRRQRGAKRSKCGQRRRKYKCS